MRAAALQFDVRSDSPAANTERVLEGVEQALRAEVELLVLPEMWPTSFTPNVTGAVLEATETALESLARATRGAPLVVCGSAYGCAGGEGRDPDRPTNRAHAFEDGREVAHYDKVHLFSPTAEHLTFAPGHAPPPVQATRAGRLAQIVCYDLRFPELVRTAFRGGAEILVVSAQWPAQRAAHWRALVLGRAVEGQFHVVACNRTGRAVIGRRAMELEFPGNSLVVSAGGEVLAEGAGEEGLIVADLDLDEVGHLRRAIPVARDDRADLHASWGDDAHGP